MDVKFSSAHVAFHNMSNVFLLVVRLDLFGSVL